MAPLAPDVRPGAPALDRPRPRTRSHASVTSLVLATGLALGGLLAGPPASAGTRPGPVAGPVTVALPDGFRPEGIAAGHGRTAYVSSLADGTIWAVDLRTGTGEALLAGVAGRALRGMQLDRRSGLLWAAGNDGTTGIVLAVDVRSGRVERTFTVDGAGFLNDLVVTRAAVWVTDSRVDRLTRIGLHRNGTPTGGSASLPITGDWPVTTGLRANGIRVLPGGDLVLAHSTAGGPFAVDPSTGLARRIPVTGGPAITGGDGLVLRGTTLYIVRASDQSSVTVLALHRTSDGWTATWRGALTDPTLDVPSTADVIGGRLWAVNARFGVADPAVAGYWLTALPLRPAPGPAS